MRRLLYILPVLAFAAAAAVFYARLGHDPQRLPSALIDKSVPQFTLPSPLEGQPGLSTEDLTGRVVLVNVFASWCLPCGVEHPLLTQLAKEKGIPIYAINYKDKTDDARRWLAQLGNPFERIGQDLDGRVAIEWGVYGVPETFVVDREGRIRHRHAGPLMQKDVDEVILPLVRKLSQ
jgi:cytochrome c biogenesis protein CcmG, thiol:disulfide interchange protein DsbE